MKYFILFLSVFILACAVPASSQTVTYEHNLNWQDNSDNEDGFKVERKTPSIPGDSFGEIGTVGADIQTYQDVVSDGQQRCYRVRAFNAAGNSAYTNEACGLPVPQNPVTLTVTVTVTITMP